MSHPLTNNMRLQKTIGDDGTEIGFSLQSSAVVLYVDSSQPNAGAKGQIQDIVLDANHDPTMPITSPALVSFLQITNLGNVVVDFGDPDSVNFAGGGIDTPSNTDILIYYLGKHISFGNTIALVSDNSPSIHPDSPFSSLVVFRSNASLPSPTCNPWLGFISINEYFKRTSHSGIRC